MTTPDRSTRHGFADRSDLPDRVRATPPLGPAPPPAPAHRRRRPLIRALAAFGTATILGSAAAAPVAEPVPGELPAAWPRLAEDWAERFGGDPGKLLLRHRARRRAHGTTAGRPGPGLKGAPPLIRVGNDGACDVLATASSNGLQQALDLAKGDANGTAMTTIAVAHTGDYGGFTYDVSGQSVTIEGGFASCSSPLPSGPTVLDAEGAADSVFEVSGTSPDSFTILLLDLEIRGSQGDADGGGGLDIVGDVFVVLFDTIVTANEAPTGGGVQLDGSGSSAPLRPGLTLGDGSAVVDNRATAEGGGLYCIGGGRVTLQSLVAVALNRAVDGAGLYLDGCSGVSTAGGPLLGIWGNQASGNGGGIYHTNSPGLAFSLSHFAGVYDKLPAALLGNSAGGHGGGAYLSGDAALFSTNGLISGNSAGGDGGGVLVTGADAGLSLRRDVGRACHTPDRCSRLTGNSAGGFGGGVSVQGQGRATIVQTYLEENSAGLHGSAVDVFGAGSQVVLESTVLAANRTASSVVNVQNGEARLLFVTLTGNRDQLAALRAAGPAPSVSLLSSLVIEAEGEVLTDVAGLSATRLFDCLLVHEASSFTGTRLALQSNPAFLFVDPAAGDYHLRPTAGAIDFCDDAVAAPVAGDADHEARGEDDPLPDIYGPFDLGADERPSPLFIDGFESGSTSAWSTVTP